MSQNRCSTCKYHPLDFDDEPCKSCRRSHWQPRQPEKGTPIGDAVIVPDLIAILDRLSALEAEVKRLASRKACQWCHGTGVFSFPHYRSSTACVVTISDNKCHYCNGTGYIESEDKC
jgi:hypothetical protein